MTTTHVPEVRVDGPCTSYTPLQLGWRWLLSVATLCAAAFVTFCLVIIGLIITSGCFMECSAGHPVAGSLWLAGTVAVAGGGVALNGAWWPGQRRGWLRAGGIVALLLAAFVVFIALQPNNPY